jgi:hypothetical protein
VARIQVMHLPGDAFALIIDDCDSDSPLCDEASAATLSAFGRRCGASAIMVTPDTLHVV